MSHDQHIKSAVPIGIKPQWGPGFPTGLQPKTLSDFLKLDVLIDKKDSLATGWYQAWIYICSIDCLDKILMPVVVKIRPRRSVLVRAGIAVPNLIDDIREGAVAIVNIQAGHSIVVSDPHIRPAITDRKSTRLN